MGQRVASFTDLLAPQTADAFFETCWEKRPLHVQRAQPDFYASLLSNRDVEASIAAGGLRYPSIQVARDGGFLPPELFTRSMRSGGDVFTGIPDLERIRAEYEAGATISLPGFHRHTTKTANGFSLHVTLGVTVYTWVDLIADWAQASRHLPSLRRALPVGFASRPDARRSLAEALGEAIRELERSASHDALVEAFARRIDAAHARSRVDFRSDARANCQPTPAGWSDREP